MVKIIKSVESVLHVSAKKVEHLWVISITIIMIINYLFIPRQVSLEYNEEENFVHKD